MGYPKKKKVIDEPVDLLTGREVAAELRVSQMTVLRLYHDGLLNGVTFGRVIRYPRAEVERFKREGFSSLAPRPALAETKAKAKAKAEAAEEVAKSTTHG